MGQREEWARGKSGPEGRVVRLKLQNFWSHNSELLSVEQP